MALSTLSCAALSPLLGRAPGGPARGDREASTPRMGLPPLPGLRTQHLHVIAHIRWMLECREVSLRRDNGHEAGLPRVPGQEAAFLTLWHPDWSWQTFPLLPSIWVLGGRSLSCSAEQGHPSPTIGVAPARLKCIRTCVCYLCAQGHRQMPSVAQQRGRGHAQSHPVPVPSCKPRAASEPPPPFVYFYCLSSPSSQCPLSCLPLSAVPTIPL